MKGIEIILKERDHQLKTYSVVSDAEYVRGELLLVATALIQCDACHWPRDWHISLFHRWMRNSTVDRLAIAGAFIAAEIDAINWLNERRHVIRLKSNRKLS